MPLRPRAPLVEPRGDGSDQAVTVNEARGHGLMYPPASASTFYIFDSKNNIFSTTGSISLPVARAQVYESSVNHIHLWLDHLWHSSCMFVTNVRA